MKLKYKVIDNQLVIIKNNSVFKPKGEFTIETNNNLIYLVKEPIGWCRVNSIPKKIVFKGNWSLDLNHNLIFTLNKTKTQSGSDRLLLKTELVEVKVKSLVFSLNTKEEKGVYKLRLLQLKGKWRSDKNNRLIFLVKKLKSSDTLILQGTWELKNNSIIYTYRKASLKTKTKKLHSLVFKGYWQMNKKNRLSYILDKRSDSYFEFKAFIETPNLIGKKGEIKYRVGIGVKTSRIITLYGVWKLNRKTGLSFEMDYGDNRIEAIRFGAFVRPTSKDKLSFSLKTKNGQSLGLGVEFKKSFLKDAEWFLKGSKEGKVNRLDWGVVVPW
ncbi:MAG: hypothetical protein P9L96_04720 [Candidatus Gygaella obscura]|nr:hypothetical protein [Candidatus Gygaella obscura]